MEAITITRRILLSLHLDIRVCSTIVTINEIASSKDQEEDMEKALEVLETSLDEEASWEVTAHSMES